MLTAYQLHFPSDVRMFRYLAAPTYSGPAALVFDGLVGDDAPMACRSSLFFNRWLEIFVTFDDQLAPAGDLTAAFPFAFNCDITTPCYQVGDQACTTGCAGTRYQSIGKTGPLRNACSSCFGISDTQTPS